MVEGVDSGALDRARERRLAEAARDGDRQALETLLAALYDQTYAVCRRICAADADAEDATQEALISIARAVRGFDGRAAVRTWAYRIATNAALDELRRRSRRPIPQIADDRFDEDDRPMLDTTVSDRLDIDAALSKLPVDFRAAVVLRDVAGMEYTEIAATLDVPVGTVRSRIARGRRQLTELLELGNRSAVPDVEPDAP